MTERLPGVGAWYGLSVLVVSPTPTHPQDHGNRKRIFEICTELKRQGAVIHFVHYPAEHDWRHVWPNKHEVEMRAAWDSYHLVAPSRPLHSDAVGDDHEIDEWADPSLSHFLAWACRLRAYDVAIVNYTWMSFCLDAIPSDVFKVCDTHDVFGGRRQLLASNGLQKEFFHTTLQDEARGLARADLVWAIKDSEQSYFERDLGLPNCLTMLHAETDHGWWSHPPSSDGYLRAGVMAARNNVNRRNIEDFLKEALPIIERYMAPIKFVIAGSCSADFMGWRHPSLTILGKVDDISDFYRAVDVVIAPIRFSTGLKIKVSEAFASGAPLVAHAHATEGFPTQEPLHKLPTFAKMALELIKLAFDHARLAELAACSRAVSADTRTKVLRSIDATRRQLVAKLQAAICIVVPMEALNPASLLHDHLLAVLDYLRLVAPLVIYVTGAPAERPAFDFFHRFDLRRQMFADPALIEILGNQAPDFWMPIKFQTLLETRGVWRAYFLGPCGESLRAGVGSLRLAIVRHDAVEVSGSDADAMIELLREQVRVVVVGALPEHIMRWNDAPGVALVVHAPFRRTGSFECFGHRPRPNVPPKKLILFSNADDPIAQELSQLGERLSFSCALFDPSVPETARSLTGNGADFSEESLAALAEARLLVDMTQGNALAAILGEAAVRFNIPRLAFQRGDIAYSLHRFASPLHPTSVGRLFMSVAECAKDPDALDSLRKETARAAQALFAADAGWTGVWKLLTESSFDSEVTSDAALKLFG